VTKPVTFDVEFLGTTPGMRGGRHVGFTARAKVNRKDWGLNWNMALEAGGWLVGDDIKLEIDVAGDEVAVATAPQAEVAEAATAGAAA
jgi:polyisoprenoid-binding protein YceI